MKQRVQFKCVSIQDAEEMLQGKDMAVLDVRDIENFRRSRLDGAQHVSMNNISAVMNETAKDRPILIYCYHGHASREYAQVFSDFGFQEVYSLDGGYEAWRKRIPAPARPTADRTLQQWLAVQGFSADDVNSVITNAMTPLMKASHQGETDVIRMLAAAGAVLDAKNSDGNNAVWLACVGGHLDAIDTLVELGVDIDNRNDNGATALMYAASTGKADVVERLLARGADTALETLDGFTALDMAANVECLTLLRRASRALSTAEA